MAFLFGFIAFGIVYLFASSLASAAFAIGLLLGGAFGYNTSGKVWEREQCKNQL